MDSARDFPQLSHEKVHVPTSQSEDDLFLSFFDWQGYCESTSSLSGRAHHTELSKLITEIPDFIGSLSLDRSGSGYFDTMKTSYGPDDEVTTASSYSGHTPPELIRGGSTSPSDHSASSVLLDPNDQARLHHEVSLREVQAHDDEWTYPQADPRKHGYPPSLHLQSDPSRRPANQGALAGLKRRRSNNGLEKRQRQLSDPDQTADVRKSGACLPCRVSKTRCHESGVCPTCRKAFPDHSHLVCTRITPAMAGPVIGRVPDVWSVNALEEEQFRSDPRFFTGNAKGIFIYFSRDMSGATLRATVQAYHSQDSSGENPRKAAFPRDKVPSHVELQQWAEQQIQGETGSDFRLMLQNFLLAYSQEGYGLPRHDLVEKVHRMNCFFRIWRTPAFYCRDPSNRLVALPLSVQAELRCIAREALKSLEHDVMKKLDDCLAQQGPLKVQEKMAIWACMWQLILMYRDLLVAFKKHLANTQKDFNASTERTLYQGLAEKFFPLMAVFYHYQFRTKKSLEMSLDWLKAPQYPTRACQSKRIRHFAKYLVDSRKELYEQIQKSTNDIDGMLCVFIVNHELKKLNARRRAPKGSTKAKSGGRNGNDECDDDAE